MDLAAVEALATTASSAVVTAAATDAFEAVRHKVARLFGRGEPDQAIEQRLQATQQDISSAGESNSDRVRASLARDWAVRFKDFLADNPDAVEELAALVTELRLGVTAIGGALAAGRDTSVIADHGTAAGVVHGDVSVTYLLGPRSSVARLPVRLPPRPDVIAGREDLLRDMHLLMTGNNELPVLVLCGMGGVGKTTLAVEYAYRHMAAVAVAWQVIAEDPAALAGELGELAAQLGGREVADPRDPVASLHAILAAYPSRWLLIFDNAPDEASVRRFLPPAGAGGVLITSQSPHWRVGHLLEVAILQEDIAAGFLVSRTGDQDMGTATVLAGELGGLPLALEQSAAYIRASSGNMSRYLALYRERSAELLARGEVADHPASVAATIGLALTRLDQQHPVAAALLRLLASLAPEPVPVDLLLSNAIPAGQLEPGVASVLGALVGDKLAIDDAVAALRRYSLVSPAADRMLLIHRLVRAITLSHMQPDASDTWRQAAAMVIEAAIPDDTVQPANWPICAVLMPHATVALGAESPGIGHLASYLAHSGSYSAAERLQGKIAEALRCLRGPDHRETLIARARLASWVGQAGNPTAARDQHAALAPVIEKAFGREHPDTLGARHELARWTGQAGDPVAARDLFAHLLPLREQILGPEDPDTLTTRHELARWTGEAGDAVRARDQFEALLPLRSHVSGPEHVDTLTTWGNLAGWTGRAGNPATARDQFAAMLPIAERTLGPKHPHVLITRANLAGWTGKAGDPAAARDQYAELLPAQAEVMGSQHPATLSTRRTLADWTGDAGDAVAARDQHASLLPEFSQTIGQEHPDTLAVRAHLARWTRKAGNAASARDMYSELVPVMERVLGKEHPDTLIIRANLARCTGMAGNSATARDMYAELVPLLETLLGPGHPDTLTARANLARWTGDAGNPGAARDLFTAVLSERELMLGKEHPDTLTSRANLARWTGRAGDPSTARNLLLELLPIRERVLGREHPNVLTTRANLARWTGEAGEPVTARNLLSEILPVFRRILGPNHPDTLNAWRNHARFTGLAGDPAAARDHFSALLVVSERVHGSDHPDTESARAGLDFWTREATPRS